MSFLDRIDPTVKKETGYIAVCVAVLTVLMEAVFLVLGYWDITVLWGGLLGAFIAILNFLLMGLTVQKAVADSLKLLNEANPSQSILTLKSFETFQKVADGQATKIIIPSEIQGIAGLASGIVEAVKE